MQSKDQVLKSMAKMTVKIIRDVAKNPNIVEIIRRNRKLSVIYDGNGLIFEGDRSQFPSIPEVLQIPYPYEIEAASRPAWYDRDLKMMADEYNAIAAPHSLTKRISYKVPPDRLTMIELVQCRLIRATADSAPDWAEAVTKVDYGSGFVTCLEASISPADNSIGDKDSAELGMSFILKEGNELNFYTLDGGSDGTIAYFLAYKATEFDV